MRATGSAFKLGISFEDWARIGDRYFHSFGQIGRSTWMADFHHVWLSAREQGLADELGAYCFELQAAKAERFATSDQANINYAYHLDAGHYARFLRAFAESHGARRIEGRIRQLEALRDGLADCIGCGCMSIDRCPLRNPGDRLAGEGTGPRRLMVR